MQSMKLIREMKKLRSEDRARRGTESQNEGIETGSGAGIMTENILDSSEIHEKAHDKPPSCNCSSAGYRESFPRALAQMQCMLGSMLIR